MGLNSPKVVNLIIVVMVFAVSIGLLLGYGFTLGTVTLSLFSLFGVVRGFLRFLSEIDEFI